MEQISKRIYSLNLIAYVAYRTNLTPLLLLDEDGKTYYGVFPECSGVELAIEEFRQKKVAEVEFLAESDCCEDCAEHSGKRFRVGEEPQLPIHPNCRCCYIPIVELGK